MRFNGKIRWWLTAPNEQWSKLYRWKLAQKTGLELKEVVPSELLEAMPDEGLGESQRLGDPFLWTPCATTRGTPPDEHRDENTEVGRRELEGSDEFVSSDRHVRLMEHHMLGWSMGSGC